MGKYKIGVVGCGYWGPNLIRNFINNPDVEKVLCCDVNSKKLDRMKSLFHDVELLDDYKKLLESDVDAIVVATPVSFHYQIAKDALKKGKHVLVEKPITKSSQEAEDLINTAEAAGKVLMVDHTFEYTQSVRKIKELIDKDDLGKILDINITRINLGLFQKDINVIWDLAPHDISILRYLIGEDPISVSTHAYAHVTEVEDTAHISLKFPKNITAHIYMSWISPKKIREITIIGNKKMLVYDDVSTNEKIKIFDKGVKLEKNEVPVQKYYDSFGEFQFLYRSGDVNIPKIDEKEPLKEVCSHFINCIETGKKPNSDGKSGLGVMKVLEAAQKSLEKKGEETFLNQPS